MQQKYSRIVRRGAAPEALGGVSVWEGEAPAEPMPQARQEPRPPKRRHYWALAVIVVLGAGCLPAAAPPDAGAAEEPPKAAAPTEGKEGLAPPAARPYDDQVRPFLIRYCQECHGGDKPRGDFRIDQLTADFDARPGAERWPIVQKRLLAGEMPPKSKPRPPEMEVRPVCDWIGAQADAAATPARRPAADGRAAAQPGRVREHRA